MEGKRSRCQSVSRSSSARARANCYKCFVFNLLENTKRESSRESAKPSDLGQQCVSRELANRGRPLSPNGLPDRPDFGTGLWTSGRRPRRLDRGEVAPAHEH